MKCRGQVVFQQSLESVFAWLAQPEHIVQLITPDFSNPTGSHDPQSSLSSEEAPSSMSQFEAKREIQNLSETVLHTGTTFQFTLQIRRDLSYEWRTLGSESITIIEYMAPYRLSFKLGKSSSLLSSPFSQHLLREYLLTFHTQQDGVLVRCTQTVHMGLLGRLVIAAFIRGSLGDGDMFITRQLQILKAQQEEANH